MSTSETKIELVTEAIETLVLASVVSHRMNSHAAHQQVLDARACLHDALAELLRPTLRVVSDTKLADCIAAPDARPAYPTTA